MSREVLKKGVHCSPQGVEVIPWGPATTAELGQYHQLAEGKHYGFWVRTGDANTRIAIHRGRPSNVDTFPCRSGFFLAQNCGCEEKASEPMEGLWIRQDAGAAAVEVWVFREPRAAYLFLASMLVDSTGAAITATNPLPVSTGAPAPGTFTPTHAAPVTVGAASTLILAAGAYKHLYFRNASKGGQRATVTGAGIVAVLEQGWTLGQTASGDGDLIGWNHPDVMPVGAFNAICSAAGGIILVSSGV